MRHIGAWWVLVLLGSCARVLENAPCPCAEGYECCVELNVCYPHGQACGDDTGGSGAGVENEGGGGEGAGTGGVNASGTAGTTVGGGAPEDGGAGAPEMAGAAGTPGIQAPFALVATQHNDSARTGANLQETGLTNTNVNPKDFGELARRPLLGSVFAQPLVVPQVLTPSGVTRDALYVATMANVVYALDAHQPEAQPLWLRTLEAPITLPEPTIPSVSSKIWHEVGILGTPVISVVDNALYVVSAGKQLDVHRHQIHKLRLSDGAVLASAPIEHEDFSSAGQAQRSALTLSDGVLYVPFGAYAPSSAASGWIFAYDTDLKLLGALRLGNPGGAGVTMGGQGPAADGGSLFFTTAPGESESATGAVAFGSRLLELRNSSVSDVVERLLPEAAASGTDELGGSGPLLIPGTDRAVVVGQHRVYVVSRDAAESGGGSGALVQSFRASVSGTCSVTELECSSQPSAPVYWPGSGSEPRPRLFVWPTEDVLRSFVFNTASGRVDGCTDGSLQACDSWAHSRAGSDSGDSLNTVLKSPVGLSVSSNGAVVGSGIVWAAHAYVTGSGGNPDGILRAFDAESLALLWSNEKGGTPLGPLAPNATPTVSGGRAFIGTSEGLSQKVIFDEEITDTPAITSFNDDYLMMAWRLKSTTTRGFRVASSADGVHFDPTDLLSQDYPMGEPGLTASSSHVYLGWTTIGEMLNVVMSDDRGFSNPQPMTQRTETGEIRALAYHATTAPALAYGNDHLVMAFHDGSALRVLSSADGTSFDLSSIATYRGYFSDYAPWLSYADGKFYLATTNNFNEMNLFISEDDGASFQPPTQLAVKSSGHPALLFNPGFSDLPDVLFAWSDVEEVAERTGPIKIAGVSGGDFTRLTRVHELAPESAHFSLGAARFKGAWYLTWMGNGAPHPNIARYSPGEIVSYGLR